MNSKTALLVISLALLACTPEPPAQPGLDAPLDEAQLAVAPTSGAADESGLTVAVCSAERSCGKPTLVCKRPDEPRPCGAAGCVEMQLACAADADCLEGYRCVACAPGEPFPCGAIHGKYRPQPCVRDRDCGSANLVCSAGACTHKPCRRSANCRGYCVSGACWNRPDWCHDTTLPPPP